jgi:hypothetical protein
MQASGAEAYQILVHDGYSHGGGGIKDTAARPCFRDRARTCEITDAHKQSTYRVNFNLDCNRVYVAEDRNSDWILIVADRFRFQRLIRHLEKILGPLLLQKKTLKH